MEIIFLISENSFTFLLYQKIGQTNIDICKDDFT